MEKKRCSTFWAKIYIAGPIAEIEQVCRKHVMKGSCVTVTPTNYIYTMGEEKGAEIGLIHYPRFPKDATAVATMETKKEILKEAVELAEKICEGCFQGSFTIMTPDDTYFYSRRNDAPTVK